MLKLSYALNYVTDRSFKIVIVRRDRHRVKRRTKRNEDRRLLNAVRGYKVKKEKKKNEGGEKATLKIETKDLENYFTVNLGKGARDRGV